MNNLEHISILEPGERRTPDLYADIPVPFLYVPAGKEAEPGRFLNFLKEGEKEEYNEEKENNDEKQGEDDEEKKENDEKEEEMEGKRRDEEDM